MINMETKIKLAIGVGVLLTIGGTIYGVRYAEAKIVEIKKQLVTEAIDQSVLSMKIKISKDGKTVDASAITKTECQQALYLASLNDAEYKGRIQGYETKINMIKDVLSGE